MKIQCLMLAVVVAFIACSDNSRTNEVQQNLSTHLAKSILSDEEILATKLDSTSYQNHLADVQNSRPLAYAVRIEYIAEANTIILYFPQSEVAPVGKITFFSPSTPKENFVFALKTDPSKRMFLLIDGFKKGTWRIKIEWQTAGLNCQHEESLNLEPNTWARPIHE